MTSPEGWEEPGQRPEFDEYTYVLSGKLRVETEQGEDFNIESGQAIQAKEGEWIRYSTPFPGGADYIAVCSPAFSIDCSSTGTSLWDLVVWDIDPDGPGILLYEHVAVCRFHRAAIRVIWF